MRRPEEDGDAVAGAQSLRHPPDVTTSPHRYQPQRNAITATPCHPRCILIERARALALRKVEQTPWWVRPEGVGSATTAHVTWTRVGCMAGEELME